MPKNDLGKIRRSQVITNAGPGAILDFRTTKGAVSALALGLEQWPKGAVLREFRLEKRLRVNEFRTPPVVIDSDPPQGDPLPALRFPRYLQCPECNELMRQSLWGREAGEAAMHCEVCSAGLPAKVYAIPAPFVTACEKGHLDDFPWERWVVHKEACTNKERYLLQSEGGAGLAGLRLTCRNCGAMASMEGSFNPDALMRFGSCTGSRPWLPQASQEGCTLKRKTLQRGASNMYFPVIASALDIPPWSDGLQQKLKRDWDRIMTMPVDRLREFIRVLELPRQVSLSEEELLREIEERKGRLERATTVDLRLDEYRQLAVDVAPSSDELAEFEVRVEQVPPVLRPWVSRLVRVLRLREVRVLRAFTRVRYPDPEVPDTLPDWAELSGAPLGWLPAAEIRGEGIFIELNPARIKEWSSGFEARAARINSGWLEDWKRRHPNVEPPRQVTPKVLLVHSLAHALIRQLSLDCGYSAASLRERLYVDERCSGLLIYTAAPDSDGTLGGLARQGRSERFLQLMEGALQGQRFCSSDPLCSGGAHSASELASGASCHACLLVAETSCEEFNRLLDRQTLVGALDHPSTGFFNGLACLA